MDVRLYLPELGLWDWCNSGSDSSWYAAQSWDPAENYKQIRFHPALEFYFKAGGVSSNLMLLPVRCPFRPAGFVG